MWSKWLEEQTARAVPAKNPRNANLRAVSKNTRMFKFSITVVRKCMWRRRGRITGLKSKEQFWGAARHWRQ